MSRARPLLWLGSLLAAAGVTLAMLAFREQLDKAHVALVYLLVVLGSSASGGRTPGLVLAVLTFLCFNFFFLPPYYNVLITHPLDWGVLGAYLVTATVASQLLFRARSQAEAAAAKAEHAEALGEADRLKNALIASVSHDLRTPLTTIKALAHELAMKGDERALTIEDEANRLNRFVADLLDLSQLNSGALRVSLEINAAEDLLGAAVQQVSGALGSRELRVTLDTTDLVLLGKFDFVHSLRILTNLIENAHKYSSPDAPVEIGAHRHGDKLLFIVADRGPGIPLDEQEQIFDAFYRPPGVAPDTAGTGLGLSIAHRLAQAQQGGLSYESRDGGGSNFLFWVPAAQLSELTDESL